MGLEADRAVRLLDPVWQTLPDPFQIQVAGLFHAIADPRGVARLRPELKTPVTDFNMAGLAVQALGKGDASVLIDEILTLTNEEQAELNLGIIDAIADVPGEAVTQTLLILADESQVTDLRKAALAALAARGQTQALDDLIDVVRAEPRGTRFQAAVEALVGAHYGRVAPVLLERAKLAGASQEQFFVRMIARVGTLESFEALREIFLLPEYRYEGGQQSNVVFLGVQLANIPVARLAMLDLLDSLPRSDYRRRAALIHALANIAGAANDRSFGAPIFAALRERLFDAEEVPQIRLLSLSYLQRDILLSDAVALRAVMRASEDGMRQYLSDYLLEFC
jgi:hypothetical protein